MFKCALCKCSIHHGELQWDSSLYGSNHLLCESCGESEERAIQDPGTNDLPELLKQYGPFNWEEI